MRGHRMQVNAIILMCAFVETGGGRFIFFALGGASFVRGRGPRPGQRRKDLKQQAFARERQLFVSRKGLFSEPSQNKDGSDRARGRANGNVFMSGTSILTVICIFACVEGKKFLHSQPLYLFFGISGGPQRE